MRNLSIQELDLIVGGYDNGGGGYVTETEYVATDEAYNQLVAAADGGQLSQSATVTPIYVPNGPTQPGPYNPFNPTDPFGHGGITRGAKVKVRC